MADNALDDDDDDLGLRARRLLGHMVAPIRSQEKIKIYEIRHPPGSRMLGIQDRLFVCLLGFKGASTTSVILPP